MLIRKSEGEAFAGQIMNRVNPADVTVYRGG
jgi:hypothetical protein